jgi:membrane protease YdiL (CAAX protease family)
MASKKTSREGFFAQLGRNYAAPPWSLFDVGMVLGVLAVTLMMIGSVLASLLSPDNLVPTPTGLVIGWTVGLILAAAFVLVRWRSSSEKFVALRIVGESAQSKRPLILMFIFGIGIGLLANLTASLGGDNQFATIAPLQGIYTTFEIRPLLLGIVFAVIVQPLAEGLIFFGVLQPRLRATIGGYFGLLITALLYAGTHYLVYGLRLGVVINPLWYGFIAPFVLGLMFGVVRVWMRSTRAVIIANIGAGIVAILVMVAV